jgi:hypothetical protein
MALSRPQHTIGGPDPETRSTLAHRDAVRGPSTASWTCVWDAVILPEPDSRDANAVRVSSSRTGG